MSFFAAVTNGIKKGWPKEPDAFPLVVVQECMLDSEQLQVVLGSSKRHQGCI